MIFKSSVSIFVNVSVWLGGRPIFISLYMCECMCGYWINVYYLSNVVWVDEKSSCVTNAPYMLYWVRSVLIPQHMPDIIVFIAQSHMMHILFLS